MKLFLQKCSKQFEKLTREMQERTLLILNRIKILPHSHVKKLVGTPHFRIRIGDYRAILDMQNDKLVIIVIELAHRKNICD